MVRFLGFRRISPRSHPLGRGRVAPIKQPDWCKNAQAAIFAIEFGRLLQRFQVSFPLLFIKYSILSNKVKIKISKQSKSLAP